jgi:L-aspartate oxidase
MKANFPEIIILGSGIAGLSLALKLAEKGHRVRILTKKTKAESNTNYAQGGLACAMAPDDHWELHLEDTLVAGDGLCDPEVVAKVVREGPQRVQELMEWGVRFCQQEGGELDLGQEGGHSKRRILHVKDMTGRAIEAGLLRAISKHPSIRIDEHWLAVDVIVDSVSNSIKGVYALNTLTHEVHKVLSPVVVLATGGSGCVYAYTTNPPIATGDGVAMAVRAGAAVRGMEFTQFHPTALYASSGERLLISEAVRGEGAILRDYPGHPFMNKYHPQADLAPRDVVVRAMDHEMKAAKSAHVWLDFTHKSESFIQQRFPNVWRVCQWHGINPSRDWIPVVPAAHYQCGGVVAEVDGTTSLKGLYACGEVASTGLHGANRLASNSLLEGVVMAHEAALAIDGYLNQVERGPAEFFPDESSKALLWQGDEKLDELILAHSWQELRRLMWDYVGIHRTTERLLLAEQRLQLLKLEVQAYAVRYRPEVSLIEFRNALDVAQVMVSAALARPESIGLHWIG